MITALHKKGSRKLSRKDSLELLLQFYLRVLVEDPIDGTPFDCAVMDSIRRLQDGCGKEFAEVEIKEESFFEKVRRWFA